MITDEQRRFGVRQRESLSEKGDMPHVMVMSATPIPRTLAVILYGDLDISVVNELPANRLPVKNCVVDTSYRPKAYRFIEKQVKMGHQAYIICPMVEESEQIEAEDVISYTEKLRSTLPQDITVSYLHGKMKPAKKNEIMEAFVKNEIQVLVSTTVIEVGVNVPNASVMMIENAEQFGLAQLHQLRGRVGRGDAQSYCILCYGKDGEKDKKASGNFEQIQRRFLYCERRSASEGTGRSLWNPPERRACISHRRCFPGCRDLTGSKRCSKRHPAGSILSGRERLRHFKTKSRKIYVQGSVQFEFIVDNL